MQVKAELMDNKAIQRSVTRIAHEIIEKNKGVDDVVLVGIKTRGVPFAKKIAEKIKEIEGKIVEVLTLDITMYRDDLSEIDKGPIVGNKKLEIDISNKIIVLVDDVLFTGRTVRAALDAITDNGRPMKVQLAVLIDRGHREFPIRPDFVGKNVPTSKHEVVGVKFEETDEQETVVIYEK
ncbi:MAG: bifunctional pyr operon transcriptional regulator/uracil phosphoribosyltransferase PyrR [Tissierellales bacterium]|jgi:pyrimidine operon attenuation protein/uracil phosphoribosyltransferase|nr:bifunctional pyr operon transcriptional regulator/uracil phosphoribosyltransferase PyrR [Tissierellales bacterium]